jgi:hypothetical protein
MPCTSAAVVVSPALNSSATWTACRLPTASGDPDALPPPGKHHGQGRLFDMVHHPVDRALTCGPTTACVGPTRDTRRLVTARGTSSESTDAEDRVLGEASRQQRGVDPAPPTGRALADQPPRHR